MLGGRRARLLVSYAAGEASPLDARRVEAYLASCEGCRREVLAGQGGLGALRATDPAELTAAEADDFWPEVRRRLDREPARMVRPARPSLGELFEDHPRLGLASAAAAVVLVLGIGVGHLVERGPASLGGNGVEILSVEAGDEASVMLFQSPESPLKLIWVFEPPDPFPDLL
jgi:anti-sigma factor RsiW